MNNMATVFTYNNVKTSFCLFFNIPFSIEGGLSLITDSTLVHGSIIYIKK